MRKGSTDLCLQCDGTDDETEEQNKAEQERLAMEQQRQEELRLAQEKQRQEEMRLAETQRRLKEQALLEQRQQKETTLNQTPSQPVQQQNPPSSPQDLKQQIRQLYLQTILEQFQVQMRAG